MPMPLSTTRARTAARLLAGLFAACTLAACGYKGPLYMPPPPAPDESLTTPPTSAAPPGAETAGPEASEPAQASPVQRD